MRFLLVLALACLSQYAFAMLESDYAYEFSQFVSKHNKTYASFEEFSSRYGVFKANFDKIQSHNAKGLSWTLGVNEFADLTWEEFKTQKLGLHMPNASNIILSEPIDNSNVPAAVDWRAKGVVNAIKNQAHCGSCWAFSTVGSIESACAIKTGKLYSLAEQMLVDCSVGWNKGCGGGYVNEAFKYEIATGGLCLEKDYPYQARNGKCHASCTKYCKLKSFVKVAANNEDALKAAVAQQPVSVAIEADQHAFQFYKGGVFDGTCGTSTDHAVVVVGYGTANGRDYWLVRNSWGTNWGEKGYMRMIRHHGAGKGQCGIAQYPSYPVM